MRTLIFAAGAQGRITAEVLLAAGRTSVAFLDDAEGMRGARVLGLEVLGAPESITERDDCEVLVALGHPLRRLEVAARLAALGFRFGTAVHPTAYVAPSARLGAGTVVCPRAVVHTSAEVGAHVIVNTAAVVEHDVVVAEGACVGPGAIASGRARVGRCAFLGIGAVVVGRVTVGDGSILGAHSLALRDVPPGVLAVGSPARTVRPVDAAFDWSSLF